MKTSCAVCGQPTALNTRIATLEDVMAEFGRTHEKEVKLTTLDGTTWDGVLESVHAAVILIRTSNLRKVWIPLDKIISVTEGRSRPR